MTIDLALLGNFLIGLVMFGAVIVAASIYIRSAIRKEHHDEVEDLAETRGKVIQDLRDKVARLEEQVQNQQGQIDMLREMKTQEIVEGVVEGIAKHPMFKA
jgi:membrane protein implicated in regulation of membrane protease activity